MKQLRSNISIGDTASLTIKSTENCLAYLYELAALFEDLKINYLYAHNKNELLVYSCSDLLAEN